MQRQTGRGWKHYTDSIPYESKRLFYELRYMDIWRYMNRGKKETIMNVMISLPTCVLRCLKESSLTE